MSYELKSQLWAEGHPEERRVVAKIYFPRDQSGLDASDRAILTLLTKKYSAILVDRRVEFSCIGYADHRGDAGYNLHLGVRRAISIQQVLNNQLGKSENYSSWYAISEGERHAVQGKATADQMAYDRRVDVCSTWRSLVVNVEKPIVITGKVPHIKRITERHFSRGSYSNVARPPTSGGDIAWKALMSSFKDVLGSGGERVAFVYGSEEKKRRKTAEFPATYRINRVDVEIHTSYGVTGMAEYDTVSADVVYTWGPPKTSVAVHTHQVNVIHEKTIKNDRSEKDISRSEADSHIFLTPPRPE